ncbi:hypothetical protein P152DRAFT_479302 [Eremomyces bilateralis CBS 781.70]|uniref:Nephrocystin 3-like N-terminal domain-containing protein n=1 Tax=Eremomyces bilateralis CBS 781.70 TaxID=1392243 RepID=A0A6G1GBT7_9PEZI|nr:uncharacterized protein P152DRAFT_479302 [Eremomyces bilateralis CBS 781.70]KAF1815360.1 hypothetical protein P152DRAFT_479302 [Eremomyces bilateralis CBS 781.70]
MSSSAQLISGVIANQNLRIVAGTIHGSVNFGSSENLNNVLNSLPTAEDAPFNTYQRQHNPACLPDTRRCIFWLNGLAGTGKSTIARTVARKRFDKQHLGASFFFSRDGEDVNHAGKFITSIAWQLANNIPSLQQHICDAIIERRDIASQSLRDQWQQLILRPLLKLGENGGQSSYILIVDALDEGDGDNNIRYGIRQVPNANLQDFVLHSISPSTVDHDISIFFVHHLKLIREEHCLDICWPSEDNIRHLIQLTDGLLIWAATACRFIYEGKRFATRRLNTILRSSGSAPRAPEKHLDEIYTTVLKQSVAPEYTDEEKEEAFCMLREILGNYFDIKKKAVDQTLNDLHSVLDVPKDQKKDQKQPLRLHHPSFRDYLLSNDRCKNQDLWVDEKQAHQLLADSCIRLMSTSLKQDICCVDAPGMAVANVKRSRVEQCSPPEVQYACLYWIQHL